MCVVLLLTWISEAWFTLYKLRELWSSQWIALIFLGVFTAVISENRALLTSATYSTISVMSKFSSCSVFNTMLFNWIVVAYYLLNCVIVSVHGYCCILGLSNIVIVGVLLCFVGSAASLRSTPDAHFQGGLFKNS